MNYYIYNYLKEMLTVKKTKDLVNLHKEKYQEILEELKQTKLQETYTDSIYSDHNIHHNNIHDEDAIYLETSLEKLIEYI